MKVLCTDFIHSLQNFGQLTSSSSEVLQLVNKNLYVAVAMK